jgi:hypothetical protein
MEDTTMFFVTLVMVALASIPLGFGIGWSAGQRRRTSIRPMYRMAR